MAEIATRRKGGGAQLRAAKGRWTPARRKAFLAELAQSMNVRMSARKIGLSVPGAYRLRKRDAAFALGWAEALSLAYEKVEMLLLERAIAAFGGDAVEAGDGGKLEKLSERTLLGLLAHHRQTVRAYRAEDADPKRLIEEEKAARAALEAKLNEMAERLAGGEADAADAA